MYISMNKTELISSPTHSPVVSKEFPYFANLEITFRRSRFRSVMLIVFSRAVTVPHDFLMTSTERMQGLQASESPR